MGSSGVIYAIIVGAWAVYLVPMWLRREDELNRARDTQRYAAAIKVLAHRDAFERRWAQATQESLPLAVGQGFVPTRRASRRPADASPETGLSAGPGAKVGTADPKPWQAAAPQASAPGAGTDTAAGVGRSAAAGVGMGVPSGRKSTRRATVAATANSARSTARANVVAASVANDDSRAARPGESARAVPGQAARYPGPRTGLMARRRRVVGALFMLSTLGALISADLGASYLWMMAFPALLLSVYIIRLRRDERIRATARARRRAAAQEAREAREADLAARQDAGAQPETARAEAGAEPSNAAQVRVRAEAQAQKQARAQAQAEAARRRSSAAGRARAQSYVQETPDLPRASNG